MSNFTQVHPGVFHRTLLVSSLLALIVTSNAMAQTTIFTYQGKLIDAGNPANAQYDIQFKLFDSADIATGNQVGTTIDKVGVQVTNGIFTVELDFGAAVFDGSARFLELGVRPTGSPNPLTVLGPRQPVRATPFAIRSATAGAADTATNATQLSGHTVDGFIQNTTTQQTATNFNIGGTGTANTLNAATQFNLGGARVLASNATSLSIGKDSGTGGAGNLFVGQSAGQASTTGQLNTFIGQFAGQSNTDGSFNTFVGNQAGANNTTACCNNFFGNSAGMANTNGQVNSFFGGSAGLNNTTGGGNAFFGFEAGKNNTTGINNSFFGVRAGQSNTTGGGNTMLGEFADVGAGDLTFATAIGAGAVVSTSNTVVIGRSTDTVQIPGVLNIPGQFTANIINATTQFSIGGNRILAVSGGSLQPSNIFGGFGAGEANTTGFNNSFFGRFAGQANTTGFRNSFFGQGAGWQSTSGFQNSFFGEESGFGNSSGDSNTFVGFFAGAGNSSGSGNVAIGTSAGFGNGVLTNATAIGYRAQVNQSNSLVLGSVSGVNQSTVNTNVGIGTTTPQTRLHISGDSEGIRIQGQAVGNPNGAYLSFADAAGTPLGYVGDGSSSDNSMYLTSYGANINLYTQIGPALTATPTGRVIIPGGQGVSFFPALEVAPSQIGGSVIANNLYIRQFNELASPSHVCWRVSNAGVPALVLTTCTSSSSPAQHKTEMQEFSGGLDLISRLKPVAFKWKEGGQHDFGLNAEDVAEVEPLLVTRNAKGEAEDVKHENMMVVFINAFKQQQSQIKGLQQEIDTLMKRQQELNELKALVCADRPNASACKPN